MSPEIDPLTGKPKEEPTNDQFVPKSEFEALKQKLDVFERTQFNQNRQPIEAPRPAGPSLDDRLEDFDKQIRAIDVEIDKAVSNGESVSKLLQQRSKLDRQATRLEIQERDLQPALSAGMNSIEFLSAEVTKKTMQYLDIVKTDMDSFLSTLPAEQRMNPEVRKTAYDLAVGRNMEKIMEVKKEEILRSVAPDPNLAASGRNGRNGVDTSYKDGVPNPKDILPPEALSALRSKGRSVDDEYKSQGYAGWEDFWEKAGKDYYGEEGAQ